ncbi:MAG: tRNA pseudouridine(55) synthase TruB [Desulfurivibrionaceae bacterium]|nr:tRNA pseudouridine(55) synthase TruB [Desulfobulbales bacterium]MDT8334668.1 tRNA pseudouridine(55) synthase TruB [Desulfurivibrionaceae bacterium]
MESGIFTVDKPAGPSSFRMVQLVRRALAIKKTGHAGTLDPFATGLLIICCGRPATRLISRLMDGEKVYEATMRLGVETSTQDPEGEVVAERPVVDITPARVEACLAGFIGEQYQVPPIYSALKHKGKPLYHYARKGMEVERQPRLIRISALECLALGRDSITIRVACGKGTYVRTLAADIGEKLGCGAHLIALRRVGSGFFSVAGAVAGTELLEPVRAREALLGNRLTVAELQARLASN